MPLNQALSQLRSFHFRPGVRLAVYRVKDLRKNKWPSSFLKSLLLLARSSYDRYGKRSLLDQYDHKSAIYLAQAVYDYKLDRQEKIKVAEWLSIRFTPGDGLPAGTGELELFSCQGRPLAESLKKRWGLTAEELSRAIVASSRMCGIHPQRLTPPCSLETVLPTRHQYTPLCFALIQRQFYRDYGFFYRCLTEIIRPDFAQKGLAIKKGNKNFRPTSLPAHCFLGLEKEEIRLELETYAYDFPAYWFNLDDLFGLINELLARREITVRTLQHYLGFNSVAEIKEKATNQLKNILRAKGCLVQAKITGNQLRRLVAEKVAVVPELKINNPWQWQRGIQNILKTAEVRSVFLR